MIVRRKGIESMRHLAAVETSKCLLVGEIASLLILSCDFKIGGTKDRDKRRGESGFANQELAQKRNSGALLSVKNTESYHRGSAAGNGISGNASPKDPNDFVNRMFQTSEPAVCRRFAYDEFASANPSAVEKGGTKAKREAKAK
jgi:hypothetical protein